MKSQKGITLIALVITIIVMLILVSVSITMAINGGLFKNAGQAAKETNEAKEAEGNLSSGKVQINGLNNNDAQDINTIVDRYKTSPEA